MAATATEGPSSSIFATATSVPLRDFVVFIGLTELRVFYCGIAYRSTALIFSHNPMHAAAGRAALSTDEDVPQTICGDGMSFGA